MSSIISFGIVRISGMSKKVLSSYAGLGVGLAVVLTVGLYAISSVVEQPSDERLVVTQPEPEKMTPSPKPDPTEQPSERGKGVAPEPPSKETDDFEIETPPPGIIPTLPPMMSRETVKTITVSEWAPWFQPSA